MKKSVSVKLLGPLLVIVISAVIISVYLFTDKISEKIYEGTDNLIYSQLNGIKKELKISNELVLQQVEQGVNILIEKTRDIGTPASAGEIEVNGKKATDLKFGNYGVGNNYELVDKVKNIVGGTATIFSRRGDEFIRISTNVKKEDGSRAVGTILDPNGKAYKSIINGESYYGKVNILGYPYLTAYVPIKDAEGKIIGIWYAGYQLSSLSTTGDVISSTRILDNGFVALLDEKDNAMFYSEHVDESVIQNVLSNRNEEWVIVEESFDTWDFTIVGAYPKSDISGVVNAERNNILAGGIVLALILGVVLFFMTKFMVLIPLKKLEQASDKFSKGDQDIHLEIKSDDEFGNLADSFNHMLESIKKSISEVEAKSQMAEDAASRAKEAEHAALNQQKYLEEKTQEILVEMKKFAHGDLTVRVKNNGKKDDIDQLFSGFNESVKNINKMMIEVSNVVSQTAGATSEISSSSEEMAAGSQEQSAQISEVAGAVEEITKTLIETSKSINQASEFAGEAGKRASTGETVINHTIEVINEIARDVKASADTVKELGESTKQISEIIKVINDIADQTNLLALNAAIEAARAGEEGRGFAVVADEVRKLAERTGKATQEIEQMISGIQKKTDDVIVSIINSSDKAEKGKDSAGEAGHALRSIVESSSKVGDMIVQVASASEQQSTSVEEISQSIEMINSVSQQSSDGIHMIARSAEDLNNLTVVLKKMVGKFRVYEEKQEMQYLD